ncbi:two-component system response regulator [Acanthopleuribacter pedis]|uniref:EAL domain-containing protein n=1 Tax=Acanthopleuribacter pedis TaxID=442870 RepID=A0A8J7QDJ9_9BACT|nr:EAL domain-containing protein [Acanthopleuribacter pedis]MBO1322572.1 EAL domain-containing protein [Acanthopleuribacter pedis]
MRPDETEKLLGKVLVVDDDTFTRRLCRTALSRHGFQVEVAVNGQDALYKFGLLNPDLVILDVNMPLMDGYQTCKALRRDPAGLDVPIIIVTGMNDYESISKSFQAGATDFLTKPINWVVLAQRCLFCLRASRAFRKLREQELGLEMAQKIAHVGSWDWKLTEKAITWSNELDHLFGFVGRERKSFDLLLGAVHPDDRPALEAQLRDAFQDGTPFSIDHRIMKPDGNMLYVHQEVVVTTDTHGVPARIRGIIQDITQRKKSEDKIRRLAYFNPLSELPNRVFFESALQASLPMLIQRCVLGIYFVDLDSFKKVNETFGHRFGDRLILEGAKRLKTLCGQRLFVPHEPRETPMLLGHVGGGRFLFFMNNIAQMAQVMDIAKRILELMEKPYTLEERELYITCSVGVCIAPHHGKNAELLLKNSERAMYHAKEMGRNNFQIYNPNMEKGTEERLSLESHLRNALGKDELLLYFQPQMALADNRVVGVEALIRWRHAERGMISPGQFIPLAEENGLILPIGAWAIDKACEVNMNWRRAGLPPITVAVNLSGRQFMHQNVVKVIEEALQRTGLPPEFLEVEITESLLMRNVDEAIAILKQLREKGITIAIDDFGTGYSSLAYLTKFPVDILKIDGSFIFKILEDEGSLTIVSAIIAMAQKLGLKVIAEGVEDPAQLHVLRELGCDVVQGYLLCRPAPPDDLHSLLQPNYFADIDNQPA